MTDLEEALSLLRKIEQNQTKALEVQAEHLALVQAQMERTEARVQESIALQRVANARQARAVNVALPVVLVALAYVGYLVIRYF